MLTHRLTLSMIGLALLIVLALPVLFRAAAQPDSADPSAAGDERLIIITPHNEQIRYEFARAFNRYRERSGRAPIAFDWRVSGGTGDLRRQVLAEFSAAALAGREDEGIGKDLFFGGGDFEHALLANGIEVERDGGKARIAVVSPIALPGGMLEEVFPSPTIGGARLYDQELRWVGVALSSFGIVYNRDLVGMLGLPQEPRTWSDLADGRYQRWVAAVDPAHSGSIAATYNVILRRHGWDEGWAVMRRILANARYFSSSSSKGPVDVSAGEAAAAICIDFYGRFQAGAIADGRVSYVDPPGMTAITPDPISILRGAPHRALADEFVQWLLSREAQELWQKRLGAVDGPEKFELRRLPARRDVYTPQAMRWWTDPVDPFELARPFVEGMPDFYRAVTVVTHALAIDVHEDLATAWRTIQQTTNPALRARMLELFDAMPQDLTIPWPDKALRRDWVSVLADRTHPRRGEVLAVLETFVKALSARLTDREALTADRLRWAKEFRGRYREIVEMGE